MPRILTGKAAKMIDDLVANHGKHVLTPGELAKVQANPDMDDEVAVAGRVAGPRPDLAYTERLLEQIRRSPSSRVRAIHAPWRARWERTGRGPVAVFDYTDELLVALCFVGTAHAYKAYCAAVEAWLEVPTPKGRARPSEAELTSAHTHCRYNKAELAASDVCGCFCCTALFVAGDVVEYVRSKVGEARRETAVCPRCGIDSVLGDAAGFAVTKRFLRQMRARYFERGLRRDPATGEWVDIGPVRPPREND